MAKSYYKTIQGVRYDRALLEVAEERKSRSERRSHFREGCKRNCRVVQGRRADHGNRTQNSQVYQ